ncbi:MAG: tetratricopeptide repeat protein [Gemmataceae bacterium]
MNVVSVVAPPPTIVFLPLPARPFDPLGDDLPDVPRVAPPIMPPAPPPAPAPPPPVPPPDRPRKQPERQPDAPAQPPRPDAPGAEYDRLIQQAREAFQTQEYGRTAARVRQALRLPERQPDAWFLLGHALIAQGKYHEAHDALVQGLLLRPDWPLSDYRPLELYDEAAEYSAHLQAAQQAWQRHPADPCLLFVVGYLLWFDGRRDEASDLFRRLLPLPQEGRSAELFLRALPAGPTL